MMMLHCETLLTNNFNLSLLSFLLPLPICRSYLEQFCFVVCISMHLQGSFFSPNAVKWIFCYMLNDKPFNILVEITPINWLLSLTHGIRTEIIGKRAFWWEHLSLNIFLLWQHSPQLSVCFLYLALRKSLYFIIWTVLSIENRALPTVLKGEPGGQMILLDLIYSNQ